MLQSKKKKTDGIAKTRGGNKAGLNQTKLNFALNEAPGKNDELNKAATQRVTRSMGKQVDWSEVNI